LTSHADIERRSMRDFNIFWASETVADVFDRLVSLGIPLLAISVLSASAIELGVISAMGTLPLLLITPIAGIIVDRSRIGRLLMSTNMWRGTLLAVLCILGITSALSLTSLAALALLVGAVAAIGNVATLAYTPVITPRSRLSLANTRISLTTAVADTLGLAAGGLLIGLLGSAESIGLSAVAFAFAGLLLLLIRKREPRRDVSPISPRLVSAQIWHGMRQTVVDRFVGPMALASAWFNAFEQVLLVNLLLVMSRQLNFDSGTIGIVLAAAGVGGLIGGFAAHVVRGRPVGTRLLLGKAFSTMGPLIAVVGLFVSDFAPVIFGAGLALFGFGTTIYNVHSVTLRQLLIAPEILGRISASYRFIAHGSIPLGALLAGVLGSLLGPGTAVIVAATSIALGSLAFAFTPPARLRLEPAAPTIQEHA